MHKKSPVFFLWLIVGSFAIAWFLYFVVPGISETWKLQANDYLFRLRYGMFGKRPVSPSVVHVDFDDETEAQLASIERLLDDTAGLEDEYINTETRQFIWQALQKLTPPQRAAIVLRYYLEFSENEISQELDRPKSSIKWTLFAARKKLQQLLKPLHNDERPADTIQQDKECA